MTFLVPHDSARPLVIAHRGGAAESPENTRRAFHDVIARGHPGVEWDVRLSADGVPVVIHDAEVVVDTRGTRVAIDHQTAAELGRVDLGWSHGPGAEGETVPTLEEVLSFPWGRTVLMVEVKPTADDSRLGAVSARAVAASAHREHAVIASFSGAVLRAAHRAVPDLPLLALIDSETDSQVFSDLPLLGFGVDVDLVTGDRVAAWSRNGRRVWTWTVKDLRQVRPLLSVGVCGLITDIPTAVTSFLR